MNTRNIGVFRKDTQSMMESFNDHIKELESLGSTFRASFTKSEIELPYGVKFIYRVIADGEDALKVCGINFYAIHSDSTCTKTQRFLMTRLRQQ